MEVTASHSHTTADATHELLTQSVALDNQLRQLREKKRELHHKSESLAFQLREQEEKLKDYEELNVGLDQVFFFFHFDSCHLQYLRDLAARWPSREKHFILICVRSSQGSRTTSHF